MEFDLHTAQDLFAVTPPPLSIEYAMWGTRRTLKTRAIEACILYIFGHLITTLVHFGRWMMSPGTCRYRDADPLSPGIRRCKRAGYRWAGTVLCREHEALRQLHVHSQDMHIQHAYLWSFGYSVPCAPLPPPSMLAPPALHVVIPDEATMIELSPASCTFRTIDL